MNLISKITLSCIAATTIFTGCSSSGESEPSQDITPTEVTVERGPLIGAYVVDNSGKRAVNIGEGKYRFSNTPSYPISSFGGYIDANRNGVVDENDTSMTLSLSLNQENKTTLTLLTTIADDEELKNEILNTYGLSEDELYSLTPSTSLIVSAISDEVFRYCIENNSSVENINLDALQGLQNNIETRISSNKLSPKSSIDIATENEVSLIDELNITLADTNTNITDANNQIAQSSIQEQDPSSMLESMPTYNLTQEQKDGLVFMYQEEKVARDVYNNLYEKWNIKVFSNIAKAEQSHMDAVKSILEKYNLDIPNDEVGVFELEELQKLYDDLVAMGSVSSSEAIKVGVLVEETDIKDLEELIVDAPEDIKVIYQSLLNGSYNHLNAFNKQVN